VASVRDVGVIVDDTRMRLPNNYKSVQYAFSYRRNTRDGFVGIQQGRTPTRTMTTTRIIVNVLFPFF
jgi:hypothetical protein